MLAFAQRVTFVMHNYNLNCNYNELQFVVENVAIEVQDMDLQYGHIIKLFIM